MKKKGLIVATIVMVLVLAVSLTTATYAWFTTTSATKVENISISAAAGAEVKIGVLSTGLAYNSSAIQDNFISGDVTIGSTGATGGEPGLGSNLNTGLSLATIAKATGMGTPNSAVYTASSSGTYYQLLAGGYTTTAPTSGTISTYVTATAANNPYSGIAVGDAIKYTKEGSDGSAVKLTPSSITGSVVMAEGTTTKSGSTITGSVITPSSVEAATANTDYLHFTLGLAASVDGIDSISLHLFVNPTDSKSTIGITTALHFDYKVDDGNWTEGSSGDVYGSVHFNELKSEITGAGATTVGAALGQSPVVDTAPLNDGWKEVTITISPSSTTFTKNTEIHQIEFYIYYDGADSDCITEALGSTCEVIFMVTNHKAA